jgi:hypothetical protein
MYVVYYETSLNSGAFCRIFVSASSNEDLFRKLLENEFLKSPAVIEMITRALPEDTTVSTAVARV